MNKGGPGEQAPLERRCLMAYLGPLQLVRNINAIMSILGTTKPSFWPFFEKTGLLVSGIGLGDLIPSETAGAAEALEDDFAPIEHPGRMHSYHFHPTGDHHLAGIDSAAYTFGDSNTDSPFSAGAWMLPNAVVTNVLMGKYDSAGTLREWRFLIDSNGLLSLELYDESADGTEIGVSATAIAIGQWIFVVTTYDGAETAPLVTFFLNAVADGTGATVEAGAYTAMEDTAAPLTVGCSGVTAAPVAEFHGRIALPFICGKALTAAQVADLYEITKPMMGI